MKAWFVPLAVLGVCLAQTVPAGAHRLDEYLQAARLSIDVDRISLEIDLTPGVSVAPAIVAGIDTNRDGLISIAESDAYAREVLAALVLSVDARPVRVTLADSRFPGADDMRLGQGTIRLRATSEIPSTGSGRHQVSYANNYRSEISVYLVNALVPANPSIQIASQRRDPLQRGLTVDYDVRGSRGWVRVWWVLVAVATVGVINKRREKSTRSAAL